MNFTDTVSNLSEPALHRLFSACYPKSGLLVEWQYDTAKGMTERLLTKVISVHLNGEGYSVACSASRDKGPDIRATSSIKPGVIVEAKGEGSCPQMFNNYFNSAIGQITQRMIDPSVIYVIALPWHKKYVRLIQQYSRYVRQKLSLEFWLVTPTEGLYDYHLGILRPDAE